MSSPSRNASVLARLAIVMAVSAMVVGGMGPATAQSGFYDWSAATLLHPGIERALVRLTSGTNLVVNCLRIDTLTPGLGFTTTPRTANWVENVSETTRQTTPAFILQSQTTAQPVVAAVNGDLFRTNGSTADLYGLNVSNGVLVSPGAPYAGDTVGISHVTFGLTRSNYASIFTTDTETPVGDNWNAVTGIYQVLRNGTARLSGTELAPRTGLGVSADTRYVYMLTIDGRSTASVGATNRQVGEWLAHFGAFDGVYVDGGGSTTMAWWNPALSGTDKTRVLNTPSDGAPRSVGNNIGVFLTTPTYVTGEYWWAGNGVRGGSGAWEGPATNWRDGAIYGAAAAWPGAAASTTATAVFAGVGGTVLPAPGTVAGRLVFQNDGFTLGSFGQPGDVTLFGPREIRVDPGATATLRTTLVGNDLTLRGPGTAVGNGLLLRPSTGGNGLTGSLTLTGRVFVEAGAPGALGTAAVGVAAGSTLELRAAGTTFSNAVTLSGSGLGGGGGLRFAQSGTLAGHVTLSGPATIGIGEPDRAAVTAGIDGPITGAASLRLQATDGSVLTLAGRNTYSGATVIDAPGGRVRLHAASEGSIGAIAAGPLGTGPVAVAGGGISAADAVTPRTLLNPLTITGDATFGHAVDRAPLVMPAPVTLSGGRTVAVHSEVTWSGGVGQAAAGASLTKTGTGTLRLVGPSTYSGGGAVTAGTLVFGGTASRPATGRTAVAAGATLALGVGGPGTWVGSNIDQLFFSGTGAGTLARVDMTPTSVVGVDTSAGDFTYGSSPVSTRGFAKLGPNTLFLTGDAGWTGGTRIDEGELSIGDGGTSGSLQGAVANRDTLAFRRSDAVTFSGLVSGPGRVVQAGMGTLTLTAANTHAGGTTVASGTLVAGHGTALGSGGTTVGPAGTLVLPAGMRLAVGGLSLEGDGRIDVGTGRIDLAPAAVSPAGSLREALIAGRHGGGWNGTRGISSRDAPSFGGQGGFAVGYRVEADNSATVAWASLGDADLDGAVTTADVNAILTSGLLNTGIPGAVWQQGDFDYDGFVTTADINALLTTGRLNAGSYLPPPGATGAAVAGVPEPATWLVAAIGLLLLVAGRGATGGKPLRGNALRRHVLPAGLLAVAVSMPSLAAEPPTNVLFIAIDDLRPMLGCYGDPTIRSPRIDRLAEEGVRFDRAYCQFALCNPSRASLLAGRLPETLGIFTLAQFVRDRNPDVVTLPEHFRNHGYESRCYGKIFHVTNGNHEDARSWSEPPWPPRKMAPAPKAKAGAAESGTAAVTTAVVDPSDHSNDDPSGSPDVADDELVDGRIAAAAVAALGELADRPFFLAVGFHKPHLPFIAPRRYWELYDRDRLALPVNDRLPEGAPEFASNDSSELRRYKGIPKSGPPVSDEEALTLIHGYHACASYVDAQVGRVLDELERLGLAERTVVVLWGDHGYHLKEQGTWTKRTAWEIGTRVPLVIRAPGRMAAGAGPRVVQAPVELLDLFPTLVDLCGLPEVPGLEGTTLVPLLGDPGGAGRGFARSLIAKQAPPPWQGRLFGRAVRTPTHRWVEWSGEALPAPVHELYDHEVDPLETRNLADSAEGRRVIESIRALVTAAGAPAPVPR
jgi:iduronate 2-sulfatase